QQIAAALVALLRGKTALAKPGARAAGLQQAVGSADALVDAKNGRGTRQIHALETVLATQRADDPHARGGIIPPGRVGLVRLAAREAREDRPLPLMAERAVLARRIEKLGLRAVVREDLELEAPPMVVPADGFDLVGRGGKAQEEPVAKRSRGRSG